MVRTMDVAQILNAQQGCPMLRGVIAVPGAESVNNATTAVPFCTGGELTGRTLLLQTSIDCYVAFGSTAAVTADAATGLGVFAWDRTVITMPSGVGFIAVAPYPADPPLEAVALKVFELV